ncbi:MAG: non-canonical purine NTP pyrophosphatase, partial [Alphaproteobacteria bacterium]
KDFGYAMQQVEDALRELPVRGDVNRAAHFVCVLSLTFPGGETHTFEGRVDGELVWPPRGDQGFGYDPIFQARGETITFGEMDPARKHGMSHRADAFAKFLAALDG